MFTRLVACLCLLAASATFAAPKSPPAKNLGTVYTKIMVDPVFLRSDLGVVRALTLRLPAGVYSFSAKIMFANSTSATYQSAVCSLITSLSTSAIDSAYARLDGYQVAMMPMIAAVSSTKAFTVSVDCFADAVDGQLEQGTLIATTVPAINAQ